MFLIYILTGIVIYAILIKNSVRHFLGKKCLTLFEESDDTTH